MWLAALTAAARASLGLSAPAQAQVSVAPQAVGAPGAGSLPLRSLLAQRPPAGSQRWVADDSVAYAQALQTGNGVRSPDGLFCTRACTGRPGTPS